MGFAEISSNNIKYQLQHLRQLVFEVTDRCNLNCKYCTYSDLYAKAYDQRENNEMPFKKARLIIDYLFEMWKNHYSEGANSELTISFYGGEPLMNISLIRQVIDYVTGLEKIGRKYAYAMTTNAMLLDKYMDYLVEKDFQLLISLDGDEYAQGYRVDHSRKNSFDRVFRNIKLLQEKYPDYFKAKVRFNSVLHNRNSVESTYQFVRQYFGTVPQIMPLNDSGISDNKKEEFKNMYQNPDESIFRSDNCEAIESELLIKAPRVYRLASYIQYQSGNVFNSYNDLFINKIKFDFPPTGTCIPFSKKMFITVNGKILPCERIDHDFFYGNVYDDHVELDLKKVADQHNTHVFKFIKQCHFCSLNHECPQCAYHNDNIRKDNVICHDFCNQKEFDKKKDRTLDFLREHPHYYEKILNEVVISH